MTVSPEVMSSFGVAIAVAAIVGRLLTAAVMPLLTQLEVILSQEPAGEPAAGDQRIAVVQSGAAEVLGQPQTPARARGWGAILPVVGWWLRDAPKPEGWRVAACVEVAAVLLGAAAWSWEVAWGMQLPRVFAEAPAALDPLQARLAAHLLLAGFLAAATWCDLRYRVIPDAITVPGLLLGMLAVTCWPEILLPVGCVLPVEPATALAVPDVLGFAGPLGGRAPVGGLLDLRSWVGLGGLVVGFSLWWMVGTAPDPSRRWYRDPRCAVWAGGAALIGITWGTAPQAGVPRHLLALATSVVGAVGAGGLIVFTREAASRALGKEAMGLGDATLMAMVGSWLGWQIGVVAFFVAAFLGLAHGLLGWLWRRESELAFGPSLCLATVIVLAGWRWVWAWVEPIFLQPFDLLFVLGAVVGLTGITLAVWSRLRGDGPAEGDERS